VRVYRDTRILDLGQFGRDSSKDGVYLRSEPALYSATTRRLEMGIELAPLSEDDLKLVEMVLRRFPEVDVVVRGVRHAVRHGSFPLGDAETNRALLDKAPLSYGGFTLSDTESSWLAQALAGIPSEEKLVDVVSQLVKQLHTRPYVEIPIGDLLLGEAWQQFLAQQTQCRVKSGA
jgi:hypothetical protein